MGYIPALDGIRAIAVGLVILSHYLPILMMGGGGQGVDLFFVLSGYLITSLLLAERTASGRISLKSFYWRRILRIWPALALMLTVYCLMASLSSSVGVIHIHAAMWAAASLTNWYVVNGTGMISFIPHTWSLSVEEQFYLVWPAIVSIWLQRKGRGSLAAFVLVTLSCGILWRAYLAFSGATAERVYVGPDTHADSLLAGCFLAFGILPVRFKTFAVQWWFIPVIVLSALSIRLVWSAQWFTWQFAVDALMGAWLIVVVLEHPGGLLGRALTQEPLLWLGQRSYGVYLWHLPILHSLRHAGFSPLLCILLGLFATFAISALSFRYLERPLLKLKDRLFLNTAGRERGIAVGGGS